MTALEGRVAFITGAGSGIGRSIAERLAREGADVCVTDLDLAGAQETAQLVEAAGRKAQVLKANAASADQLGAAVSSCVETLGRLDIAVANAGIGHAGSLLDMPLADWQDLIDVNLTGVFLTAQAAAREMVRAGRGGRIVCISSLAAEVTGPLVWAYSATKAGVRMLVRGWAQELGASGITVNAIGPGVVETPLALPLTGEPGGAVRRRLEARTPVGRVGRPEDVAGLVAFMVGPDGGFMTGSYVILDGGQRDSHGGDEDPERIAEHLRLLAAGEERRARLKALLAER